MKNYPVIAIVAGEPSGDILGANLIYAMKEIYPNARFVGVAGEKMQQAGCQTLFPMSDLSVMGLFEVLKHLPKLLQHRQTVINTMLHLKPDVFIGIDAPDFNIPIEQKLKTQGIKTVHYVSPSVWAWRQKRVFKIKKATDLLLSLLPFEKQFFDKFGVNCQFVGHTMADEIPLNPNRIDMREKLDLQQNYKYLAILFGSRRAEIKYLAPEFLKTALLVKEKLPEIEFLAPFINQARLDQFLEIKNNLAPDLKMNFFIGKAREVLQSADCALVTSGTATLETMLCKTPMVVGYKMNKLTHIIAKRLIKTPFIALPNLLANKLLVDELLQNDCIAENLAPKIVKLIENSHCELIAEFIKLHQEIKQNADLKAATAISELIQQ